MKLVSGIVDSGFFAQSALSAEVATKDSLGRNISETYLTSVDIQESANWNSAYNTVHDNSATWNTVTSKADVTAIPSLEGYATENWVTSQGYLTTETDWTDTITAASSYAYEQATAAIPAPFDPTYLSGQIDTKLDSAIYAADSGNFLTELPSDLVYTADIQDMATTGDLTGKQDITGMTAYATVESLTAKQDAGDYLSASDSANFLLTSDSGNFITAHQELPESANWNSTYNTVHDNSASWTGGIEYTGIEPIVVNNTVHQISANTWALAIGDGLSAVEDDVNRQTIISVTGSISVETGSI